MAGIIKKITTAARNNTTYKVGLLQAKAYRVLKQHTGKMLEQFKVSTVEWAFLGLLNGNKEGMKAGEIAKELGVQAPFVTTFLGTFQEKGFVTIKEHPSDSRAKMICLTSQGEHFVATTESYLKEKMRPLIKDVSTQDLLSYLCVLEKIIQNSEEGTNID